MKAVAIIKPKIMLITLVPIILIMLRAILLCKFHFCMAIAIINPPTYKKTYLCPKDAVVSDNSSPPVRGNNTIGIRAVTAIGIASVIHQIAIQIVDAKTALACGLKPSG